MLTGLFSQVKNLIKVSSTALLQRTQQPSLDADAGEVGVCMTFAKFALVFVACVRSWMILLRLIKFLNVNLHMNYF